MNLKEYISKVIISIIPAAIIFLCITVFQTAIIVATSVATLHLIQILTVVFAVGVVANIGRLTLKRLKQIKQDNEQRKEIKRENAEIQANPTRKLIRQIQDYFDINESTPFFENIFDGMTNVLPDLKKQQENIHNEVAKKLGADGLTYRKFAGQADHLVNSLLTLGTDFVQKMNMFDEEKYQSMVSRLESERRYDEASKYNEILQQYKDYAKNVEKVFESATIEMDKLLLELGKLDSPEIENVANAIEELDIIVQNTKLYQ